MKKYYKIKNYVVKCRLYPNKTQAGQIDDLIEAARLFHNAALYDILVNKNPELLIEKPSKDNPEEKVHFIDFKKLRSAAYINTLREKDPRINRVPGSAISGQNVGIVDCMKEAWERTGKHPIENFGKTYTKDGIEHKIGISYYSNKNPRMSYAYQTPKSNIKFTNNEDVMKIKLSSRNYPVDGLVKIRGFNNDLRFNEEATMTFNEWLENTKSTKITIVISKDKVGDYFICFILNNIYKSINEDDSLAEETGVDVGEIDLITAYDGHHFYKSGNLAGKNRRVLKERKAIEVLEQKMARKEGWKNEDFRNRHKQDKRLEVSKSYKETELKHKKNYRKITRQRKDFQSKEVMNLIKHSANLSIEALKVKDMFDK